MTALEIKRAAEAYVDEIIDDDQAITAINRALAEIGDQADLYSHLDVNLQTPGEEVDLPSEAISVYMVESLDRYGEPYEDYRQIGHTLFFRDPGRFRIHYRRMPSRLPANAINARPDIPDIFHEALVTYVAAWWKLQDDDESPDGLRLMDEFKQQVLRISSVLRRRRVPRTVPVYRSYQPPRRGLG